MGIESIFPRNGNQNEYHFEEVMIIRVVTTAHVPGMRPRFLVYHV